MGEPDWKERYLILEGGVENCLGFDRIRQKACLFSPFLLS